MVFWHFPCCLFLFNAHRLIRYCTLPYTYNCTVTYTPVWTSSHARCTCAYTHDVRHDIRYCTHAYTEFCTSVYTEKCTGIYTDLHRYIYANAQVLIRFLFLIFWSGVFAMIATLFTLLQFFYIEFYKIVTFGIFGMFSERKKRKSYKSA